jgi:transposase-like protein
MSKKYVVKLTADERAELEGLIHKGRAAHWKLQRAQAILAFDQGEGGLAWPDSRIAEAYGCTTRSLENWRKQAVEQGPLSLLERKPSVGSGHKLDGEQEARLTKLACSEAPKGHARWSLRLLAEQLVELQVVESISHETVRRALKKAI